MAVINVPSERLQVLSERAGGLCVGAPATREEERAMAKELLELREFQRLVRRWMNEEKT